MVWVGPYPGELEVCEGVVRMTVCRPRLSRRALKSLELRVVVLLLFLLAFLALPVVGCLVPIWWSAQALEH